MGYIPKVSYICEQYENGGSFTINWDQKPWQKTALLSLGGGVRPPRTPLRTSMLMLPLKDIRIQEGEALDKCCSKPWFHPLKKLIF